MNRDAIAFALILAGALCAECIPLAAVLIGVAWVVKAKKSRPRSCNSRGDNRAKTPDYQTKGPIALSFYHTWEEKQV